MSLDLKQGSVAIADAAISAGCSFFAGYPMEPFTALLEAFSGQMAAAGRVCVAAESEIEGINMAIGAASTGARAATGSTGQGLALMQEAIAEAGLNELPLVVFNMARGQQDYFQATRGGGWGDYRTISVAPKSVTEAAALTQDLFDLADRHRTPVIMYGDYIISGMFMSVDTSPRSYAELPAKDWAIDGTLGGTAGARVMWNVRWGRPESPGVGANKHWQNVAHKYAELAAVEARHESLFVEDAETVVVSFGTTTTFVEYVVEQLRADGVRIGSFRPITLWPFPETALDEATRGAKRVLVLELNGGQMIDDVRLSVADRSKIVSIGGVSQDSGGGMKQGDMYAVEPIRSRILGAMA